MAYCQSDFKIRSTKIGNFPEGNFSGVRSPERAGRKSVCIPPHISDASQTRNNDKPVKKKNSSGR
jgi:hypothetical protein